MPHDTCLCTVLLFTYNHAPYFKKAIDSVLEQETRYPFKVHVFDDASTDGTSDIVRAYAEKYPDKVIPFIAEKNQGAQTNIWNAYRSVDTKYCATLETDDFWCDKEKLELQITALEKHPKCSFSAHQTLHDFGNDTYRQGFDPELIVNKTVLANEIITYDMIENEPVASGYITHPSSRVIRTDMLDLNSIKYREAALFDNCQFFYLLLKGPMFFINRVMNHSYATGAGACTGVTPCMRAERHVSALLDFNRQTNYVIGQRILEEAASYLHYSSNLIRRTDKARPARWVRKYSFSLFGFIPCYAVYFRQDKTVYKILGVPILHIQATEHKKTIKICGIRLARIRRT